MIRLPQRFELFCLVLFDLATFSLCSSNLIGNLVYAVNAGGSSHTDSDGIFYEADPCHSGISSDYGKRFWTIGRVDPSDAILYQTERYGLASFGYQIPVREDGDYVLVLKFSEVYFLNPRKKVFDVFLNKVHQIVKDLDIFDKVGHGVAHDEIIPFKVSNKAQTLIVNGGDSRIRDKEIQLQFIKGPLDNPKINAFYVIKGTVADVPTLPPYDPTEFDPEHELSYDENQEELHQASEDEDDDPDEIQGQSQMDDVIMSQRAKRRRRIIQRPAFQTETPVDDNDWNSYILVGGSFGIALVTVYAIRKIIS